MPVGEPKHLLLEKLVASYAQTRNQKKLEKKNVSKSRKWTEKNRVNQSRKENIIRI